MVDKTIIPMLYIKGMEYRSSFVGIPLPKEYLEEFVTLTEAVKGLVPDIRIVDLATPHVTVFFFGNQERETLEKIASRIEQKKKTLTGKIEIGESETFGGSYPRVLYLKSKSESLDGFYREMLAEFSNLRKPEREGFEPHLTVGRMKGKAAKDYLLNKQSVHKLLEVNWEFPIREIAVYGIDSGKIPNHQEKLISIIL